MTKFHENKGKKHKNSINFSEIKGENHEIALK